MTEVDAQLVKVKDWGERRWFINGQGQTFAVIDGPVEFRMGAPATDTERIGNELTLRRMGIPRRFAIATKEVTVEQFQRFGKLAKITNDPFLLSPSGIIRFSPDPQGPWIGPDWYITAHYCNWLSEQEGLPKDQWVRYLPNDAGAYLLEGMLDPLPTSSSAQGIACQPRRNGSTPAGLVRPPAAIMVPRSTCLPLMPGISPTAK